MMVHALERHSGEALAVALIFAYQFLRVDGFPVLDADRSLLTTKDLLSFERNGFIRIPSLLSKDEVEDLKGECLMSMEQTKSDALLHALNTNGEELAAPFLQHFNPWRSNAAIARYSQSSRLASIAAQLLNAKTVRLYQDCIFQKRPGDAPTDWHADLKMTPLDTNDFITVWIALDDVPAYDDGGSGLHFIAGSHRDFALPYWHWNELTNEEGPVLDLTGRFEDKIVEQDEPLLAGDCTWHHGWCLHSAPDLFDDEKKDRVAFTASYVADGARLLDENVLGRQDGEDSISYEGWADDIAPGDVIDHELLPLVWPPKVQEEEETR